MHSIFPHSFFLYCYSIHSRVLLKGSAHLSIETEKSANVACRDWKEADIGGGCGVFLKWIFAPLSPLTLEEHGSESRQLRIETVTAQGCCWLRSSFFWMDVNRVFTPLFVSRLLWSLTTHLKVAFCLPHPLTLHSVTGVHRYPWFGFPNFMMRSSAPHAMFLRCSVFAPKVPIVVLHGSQLCTS